VGFAFVCSLGGKERGWRSIGAWLVWIAVVKRVRSKKERGELIDSILGSCIAFRSDRTPASSSAGSRKQQQAVMSDSHAANQNGEEPYSPTQNVGTPFAKSPPLEQMTGGASGHRGSGSGGASAWSSSGAYAGSVPSLSSSAPLSAQAYIPAQQAHGQQQAQPPHPQHHYQAPHPPPPAGFSAPGGGGLLRGRNAKDEKPCFVCGKLGHWSKSVVGDQPEQPRLSREQRGIGI